MGQIHLFPTITDWIELEAKSPKRAFWKLMLEECMGEFWIIKESGAGDRLLDRRRWGPYPMAKALKLFERKIREKLNPDRASPRKYKIRRRPSVSRRLVRTPDEAFKSQVDYAAK